MLSFAAVGLITTGSVLGEGQPSVASDQSDYAPSASVSLIGSGWLDGETVHVTVDDDQNDPWFDDVDLTAGDDGTVADSCDLPDVAGTYSVSATAPSGSASTTFTATAPAPPPPPPAASPTLSSDESTYAPGSAVTLSGTNWTPGSTVHIVVDDDKSDAWDHIADVTAGANGSLSDTFELPTGLAATFTASATDSSDKNATATFTSVSAPPGSPTLDSDKETYAPGAHVTLSGTNWTPGSAVHIVVDDDKSDSWTHTADVAAGVDGKISDSFSLPSLSATFTATATGMLGQSATTTFSAGFGSATEHFLVRFASGTSTATQAQILASAGAEDNNYIAPLRIHGVLLPGGAGLQPSIDKLRSYQSVTRVEPDRAREAGATPDDPATRPVVAAEDRLGPRLRHAVVPRLGDGRVLDTGVDGSHPDLDGNLVVGHVDPRTAPNGLTDPNGHGTAMAGIVAAETEQRRRASPASATPASRSCRSRCSAPTAPARTATSSRASSGRPTTAPTSS